VISEYVERLASELDFDPSLSRRVRREVEDHLWEAVSADPATDRLEAERRAVANFGDPRAIAARFAVVSLTNRARRLGAAAVLLVAAAFVVMKARFSWYGLMQWPAPQGIGSLGSILVSIDLCAFWLSFFAGTAGWLYIGRLRFPTALTDESRRQLGRFSGLCLTATGALVVSVVCDGALTVLRFAGKRPFLEFLLPAFSMAVEIACAGLLVSYLRNAARTAWTSRVSAER
jgi:hypothetical protein